MLKKFVQLFGGDPNKREIDRFTATVEKINSYEAVFEALSDDALRAKTAEFRLRHVLGESLDDILPEAFAAVREASKRTLGLRHYDVQLIGGTGLHQGKIAEMRTGEGKTLVATLPIYLNALSLNPAWIEKAEKQWGKDPASWEFTPIEGIAVSRGVHLITVNDYLARRDARWMAPIYTSLDLSVGVLQMAARTENGQKAFLVDFSHESPHEDQHHLLMVDRRLAYNADITYGTNSEFGFDYLRDNMTMRLEARVQRGHYYAIVDEVDNVLIDEARTPLIISGPAQDEGEWYNRMAQVVRALRPEDIEISEKDRNVTLTEIGEARVEEALGTPLRDPDRPEDITHEQARLLGYLEQALRAQFLFKRNKDYLVQGGKVVIIDEFTGRLMPGRRWSDGLHQAVEAKEGVKVENESVTYATITIQNYFRMYEKLAGMTGTAVTEAEEFDKIYKLGVLAIPTNLEYSAINPESGLEELEDRDPQGYKQRYYSRKDDPNRTPIYWRRKDYPDVIYRTEEAKLRAITREILHNHVLGRPMLVGTTSVELSERVSTRLRAEPLRRLCQVLLLRATWLMQHNLEDDGRQVPELQFLNQPLDRLDPGELRKMGRELSISFNPEDPENLERLYPILDLTADGRDRLVADLQGGIPHEVLNARKHTEESQIIAGAGAYGAVTIATNMAGRGVDIKLGGELAEEILAKVHRVLHRAGYETSYEMSMEELQQVVQGLDPDAYGIHDAEIQFFLKHMDEMEKVRSLGGLHVIGSERHEARRIDNQLRGRSARQGDPGSSRFYLSMEDELMRLFGGQQADGLMQRLKIDDAIPLEVGLVARLVEQAQTRVEGSNFDIRKHLLEYDDVLNTQRAKIYAQRNRIFTKEDLSEDVNEMFRTEVARRVPEALKDEGGPWKLLSWLESVQPPFSTGSTIFPSYALRLISNNVLRDRSSLSHAEAIQELVGVARQSILAERDHLLLSIQTLLEQNQEKLEAQVSERMETVDTYLDGLANSEDENSKRPTDMINELTGLLHVPIKATTELQRALRDDPRSAAEELHTQIENLLISQTIFRLVGAVERRLEEPLEINPQELMTADWETLANRILSTVEERFEQRLQRYVGEGSSGEGQISRDLENVLQRMPEEVDASMLVNLLVMLPQGSKASFDKRTHRRVLQRTTRLTYIHFAASYLENHEPAEISEDVLSHLESAHQAMVQAWGISEINRLSNFTIADLDEYTRSQFAENLDQEPDEQFFSQQLGSLAEADREAAVEVLGRRSLTEIYRQLLLNVITELWVDYLTQMEALRISIGLEAYGQRDPLVQYKNRAFSLFQNLLGDMRLGVINRMFTYRPRDMAAVQSVPSKSESPMIADTVAEAEEEQIDDEEMEAGEAVAQAGSQGKSAAREQDGGKKKRRRHR